MFQDGLIVDNFAGGGGASLGIEMAFGRSPDIAINHDEEAIAMHRANHPATRHFCKSIYQVDPDDVVREYKKPIEFAWFSPDCTHHSKARGGKPKEKHIRDLAWVVPHWAERGAYKGKRPQVMIIENVEEFQDWGLLLEDGTACPVDKGKEFTRWVRALRKLGYEVEWRELRACDYGAPTIRKRLFVIARCDGLPIVWPDETHGKELTPYRTAAECIDFSIPCPSIFLPPTEAKLLRIKRPLADNTLRRIAKGIQKFVIDSPAPFIIKVNHGYDQFRGQTIEEPLQMMTGKNGYGLVTPYIVNMAHGGSVAGVDKPMSTICTEKGGTRALVTPFITKFRTGSIGSPLDEPMHTITGGGKSARPAGSPHAMGLVTPILIGAGGPARAGEPRTADKPLNTIMRRNHTHLVTAFLAQHNSERGDGVKAGRKVTDPFSTVTSSGSHQQLVTSHLLKLKGTCKDGQSVEEPLATVQAQGLHYGEVRAFLMKYYGTEQDPQMHDPLHTITSKDRFGLVMVHGEPWLITDIGMRMLTPRELYRAQGFTENYIINPIFNNKPLSKSAQVRMCGNSVSPPPACALARANSPRRLH